MKVKYLVMEREFGSGGTQIAKRLEANTGIPCYGKQIIENAAKTLHLSMDEIEKYEENVTGSLLYTLYMMAQAHNGDSDMLTREGKIFVAEQSEIQKMAKQGSGIFLGHCAAEALKEEEGVIKAFIHCSDEKKKYERIQKEYGVKESEVASTMERFNKKRANYYYANTGRKWRDYRNYDIVLDSAVIGIEGCVAVLSGVLFG